MKRINKLLYAPFIALLLGITGCGTNSISTSDNTSSIDSIQAEIDPLLTKYNTIQEILIDTANAVKIPQKNDFSKKRMLPSIKKAKTDESKEGENPSYFFLEFEEGEYSELKSFIYPISGATAVIESLLQHGYGNLDITNKICFFENDSRMNTLRVSYLEEYENLVMIDYYFGVDVDLTAVICNEPNNEYVVLAQPFNWDKEEGFYFEYERINKGYSAWNDKKDISVEEKLNEVLASNNVFEKHGYSTDPIEFMKKIYEKDGGGIDFNSLTYDENNEDHILLKNLPKFGYLGWETLYDSYFVLHRNIPEGYMRQEYKVDKGIYVETTPIAYKDEPYSGVALNRIPDDVTRVEQCGLYYALEVPTTCEYINIDCLSKCEYIFVRGKEVNEKLKSMLEENDLTIQILCQDEYLDVYGMLTPSAPHFQQVENNK